MNEDIKLFLTDIDGVLTDGKILCIGDETYRFFDIRDGLAVRLLKIAGIDFGIISGKISAQSRARFQELGADYYFEGIDDKISVAESILLDNRLSWKSVCYMGDDLPDIGLIKKAGLSMAPCDAVEEIRQNAHHICKRPGGHGAFREAVEFLLRRQEKWETVSGRFF